MIRVKIIKPHKQYSVGETVVVTPNIAHGLIDGGYALQTKDIVTQELRTTDGRNTTIRPRKSK